VGAAVVALAVVASGVTYAVGYLSGGGTQPEQMVPADAVLFAKVDLDPAAEQKVAAARFLRNFPALRDDLPQLRRVLFENLLADATSVNLEAEAEADADATPWLGRRAGFAVLPEEPESFELETLTILQVTDEAAAREALPKLLDVGGDPDRGLVVRDGYALIADDQASADRHSAAAADADLAGQSTFAGDVDALDGAQVGLAWGDLDRLRPLVARSGQSGGPFGSGPTAWTGVAGLPDSLGVDGRFVYGLRFSAGYAEITGRIVDSAVLEGYPGAPTGTSIGNLPGNTLAAAALAGGGQFVTHAWGQAQDKGRPPAPVLGVLDSASKDFRLPEDLVALLGDDAVLAVDPTGVAEQDASLGARVRTDPAALEEVFTRRRDTLEDDFTEKRSLLHRRTGDGGVIATSPDFLDLLEQGGDLGAQPAFRTALPDAEGADFALWVDVNGYFAAFAMTSDLDFAKPIDGFGITASLGDGEMSYRLRLVVDPDD